MREIREILYDCDPKKNTECKQHHGCGDLCRLTSERGYSKMKTVPQRDGEWVNLGKGTALCIYCGNVYDAYDPEKVSDKDGWIRWNQFHRFCTYCGAHLGERWGIE